jgi:DNA-binding HxlR family transcriptional regulator
MKHKSNKDSVCPVARSLDVVGEWWSLLIIRDAMLGVKRFSDFERRLSMAKNILTARLKTLVEGGILRIVPASDGSAYNEYELTPKGADLLPVMVAFRQWGEKYMFPLGDEHSELHDKEAHQPLEKIVVRSQDGRPVGLDDLELSMTSAASKETARHSPASRQEVSS